MTQHMKCNAVNHKFLGTNFKFCHECGIPLQGQLTLNEKMHEALKALMVDSCEFHDAPGDEEERSGAHTNCGWCMAAKVLAEAQSAGGAKHEL